MSKDMTMVQLPRVSVSMNRKINLGNYESIDIFVSYATDVPEESTASTLTREVIKGIEAVLETKVSEYKKPGNGSSAPAAARV